MKFLKIISFIEFSMFFFDCNVGLLVSISNKISLPKIFRLIILKSFFLFFSISERIFFLDNSKIKIFYKYTLNKKNKQN